MVDEIHPADETIVTVILAAFDRIQMERQTTLVPR
jgi:hypothetical protein